MMMGSRKKRQIFKLNDDIGNMNLEELDEKIDFNGDHADMPAHFLLSKLDDE